MTAINPKLVTTAFDLPGCRIVRNFGCRARHRRPFAQHRRHDRRMLQTLVGGNITLFTQLCEKAREDAFS